MSGLRLLVCYFLAVACEGCSTLSQQHSNDASPPGAPAQVQEPVASGLIEANNVPPRLFRVDSPLDPLADYLRITSQATSRAIAFVPSSFDYCAEHIENGARQFEEWSDQYVATRAAKSVIYGTAAVAFCCAYILGNGGMSGGPGFGFGK